MTVLNSLSRTTIDALTSVSKVTHVITNTVDSLDKYASAWSLHADAYKAATERDLEKRRICSIARTDNDTDHELVSIAEHRVTLQDKLDANPRLAEIFKAYHNA